MASIIIFDERSSMEKQRLSSKQKRTLDDRYDFDVADDGERRAEGVAADVLALDPEEPRVGWCRHLPKGVATNINY